ncbi:MAG TPA: hypothetical protein VFR01_06875, partial [Geobacterales bacterium]|nr:hypothetical protein [Geobacterales bacterium]
MMNRLTILPSTSAVDAYRGAQLSQQTVLLGHKAVTLRRLGDELITTLSGNRRIISPVGRKLLLDKLVERESLRDATILKELATFPGFISSLAVTFDELKQSLVTPELLTTAARRRTNQPRLTLLTRLFTLYNRELQRLSLQDHLDALAAVADSLEQGSPLPPLLHGVSSLEIRNIYDVTPLQRRLLSAIARRLPVTVDFPFDDSRPALFSYVSRSIDDFESLDNGDLQLELTFSNPLATPFSELLATLFAEAPTAPATLAGVRLMALPGSMPECEEIGRAIRRLLAKGVSPTTSAIVARDTSRYGGVLEDVCRRYRIPLSYRRGAPLATSPLIATILAPLRLALSQLERDELLTLIGST